MSRILIGNLPAYGHLTPTLSLVGELVRAGHTVDYLASEHFRAALERAGATLLPLGARSRFDPRDGRSVLRAVPDLMRSLNREVRRLAPGYDLVAVGGMDPAVPELEHALEVPVVYLSAVFLQNARTLEHMLRICRDLPGPAGFLMRHRRLTKALSPALSTLLSGTRVPDLLDLFGPQSRTLNITFTSRAFQPCADDFDARCLFVGPSLTPAAPDARFPLQRLRDHEGPVVYATLGTVYNRWTSFFHSVIEAFGGSDALVVIAAGHPDRVRELGPVPANVLVHPFVPQAEVLAHADLMVAHGGMGTVSDAIANVVPAVLVPLAADQFFNAFRLEELGAARVVSRRRFDAGALRRAAAHAMADDAGRAAMVGLRDSFRSAGGGRTAVAALEHLLGSSRSGGVAPVGSRP